METAVPALAPVRTGERDVLPFVRPTHLVALQLHVLDEALAVDGVLQCLVDGLDQIQLPAVAAQTCLILAGFHALLFGTLLRRFQHTQPVGQTDFIVDFSVEDQIAWPMVELASVLAADTVYHEVVVQMTRINVGGNHYLEVRELPLGKLQTDGVDLLGRDIVLGGEGLDEVVELHPIGFSETIFGSDHFDERGLRDAVVAGDQSGIAPACFLFLSHIVDHIEQ